MKNLKRKFAFFSSATIAISFPLLVTVSCVTRNENEKNNNNNNDDRNKNKNDDDNSNNDDKNKNKNDDNNNNNNDDKNKNKNDDNDRNDDKATSFENKEWETLKNTQESFLKNLSIQDNIDLITEGKNALDKPTIYAKITNKFDEVLGNIKDLILILYSKTSDNKIRNYLLSIMNFLNTKFSKDNDKKLENFSLLMDFIKKSYSNIRSITNDEELFKKWDQYYKYSRDYDVQLGILKYISLPIVLRKINEKYYDNKDQEINQLIENLNKSIKELFSKKDVDNEDAQKFLQDMQIFDKIIVRTLPKISVDFKNGIGIVANREIPSSDSEFFVNNISSANNDAFFIDKTETNSGNTNQPNQLSRNGISDSGILYIPNDKGKLNTTNINFQKLIDTYQNLSKTSNLDREKEHYAFLIGFYKKLLANSKNPNDLTDNKLIASYLNNQDLQGKYILRATISLQYDLPPADNQIPYFAIESIKMDSITNKITVVLAISNSNNKIYPKTYEKYSQPVTTTTEPYSYDLYIPVDANEFNKLFLGGKTPAEVAKNSTINLDISRILEISQKQ